MKIKSLLVSLIFAIAALIIFGLLWFWLGGSGSPVGAGWYFFSFAAGLTMIVLPCTLPLAFVIVPLSMGKGPVKGLLIALSFGLGVTLTLSLYGVFFALLGEGAIKGLGANIETVKNWMYVIAGLFALGFALGEIGLVKFRMPTYTGAAPEGIQKKGDYLKAFFLGMFLGNIGVGCPHPATPVILTRIATSGSIFYGWLLFLIHAIGRVLPLLLLAILGVLGVNALNWLVARKDKIERATGWGMVFVAGYILVLGLFSHDWWVASGQHTLFESLTQEHTFTGAIAGKLGFGAPHTHGMPTGTGLFGLPLWLGNWFLVFLWSLPLWWYWRKKKKEVAVLPEGEEKHIGQKDLQNKKWLYTALTALFLVVIVYTLPQRFLHMNMEDRHEQMAETGVMPHIDDHGDEGQREYQAHYAEEVAKDLVVQMATVEGSQTGKPTKLMFQTLNRPVNSPIAASTLEEDHTKLIHVIGLRKDLNEFFHIHPAIVDEANGIFAIEHTFQKPGEYYVWAEVKKDGVNHAFAQKPLMVLGQGAALEKAIGFGRNVIAGNYQAALDLKDPVQSGKEWTLNFDIHTLSGREVELDDYIGAQMHLNIISEDLKTSIHAHPEGHTAAGHALGGIKVAFADAGHGDDEPHNKMMNNQEETDGLQFHVSFPKAGLYKAFAQFRPKGADLGEEQALVAAFWIKVVEPKGFDFSGTGGKILLTIISLILMAILSIKVKRYLTV